MSDSVSIWLENIWLDDREDGRAAHGRLHGRRGDGDQQAEPYRRPLFLRHVAEADFTRTAKPCFSNTGRAFVLLR